MEGSITRPPAPSYRIGGDFVLLSGHVSVDENWRPVGGTFQNEARAAFRNVHRTLETAGAEPHQIVKVTAYLSDLSNLDAYNQFWLAEFPDEERPARTTIGAALYQPFRIELDVVALLRTLD